MVNENKEVKKILQLKEYPLEKLNISELKHDKSNPNVMTDQMFDGLRYSIRKYGDVEPIKVAPLDKAEGEIKYLIIDGHHRVKALEEEGINTVKAYIINDLSPIEIKLARQAFNKIHGEHVPEKDIQELELILNHNAPDLEALIGTTRTDVDKMKELMSQPNKDDWAENLKQTANMENLEKSHQVTLIFNPTQFNTFNKIVNSVKIENKKEKATTTIKLMTILREYHKFHKGGIKISSRII